MQKIRKAVFPVAGMGTRFLPATKASAKEMLPIVDKPLIQYAAEEAVAAGCTELIFITGRNKRNNQSGNSILGVETVDPSQTGSYGIVEVEQLKSYQRVTNIVEKPKPEDAPSNLAVVGRYILTLRIFDLLTNLPRGAGGEIQLTDGIARLLDHEFVLAHAFEGKRYDCGSKLGYLEATVAYGLKHPELKDDFKELLKQFV
ncbi:UTP--glucose-1-phosphate uridylyltransferase [Neisseria meningitidis]|nr:UTP--glucose-1-phosphate uridylyltransferase [Neisseria meningitidis]